MRKNYVNRTTQLDRVTDEALTEWARAHGVHSLSAAMRSLLQRALAGDAGPPAEAAAVAAAEAWEETSRAVREALDKARPGRPESAAEHVARLKGVGPPVSAGDYPRDGRFEEVAKASTPKKR